MTIRDKLIESLKAQGYEGPLDHPSVKYVVFKRRDTSPASFYYVGKNGGFRTGFNLATSISINAGRYLRFHAKPVVREAPTKGPSKPFSFPAIPEE